MPWVGLLCSHAVLGDQDAPRYVGVLGEIQGQSWGFWGQLSEHWVLELDHVGWRRVFEYNPGL